MRNITIVNFIFIILPTTKRVEASMLLVWRIRASNEPSRRLMFFQRAPTLETNPTVHYGLYIEFPISGLFTVTLGVPV